MPVIWIKAAALVISLACGLWASAAFWRAYRLTRSLYFRSGGLGSLILVGATVFILSIYFTSADPEPTALTVAILLFAALGNCAAMWFGRSYFPHYRHSRDILLFRPPDEESSDPARGLYVPKAPPVPPPAHTQRRIAALLIIVSLTIVVAIMVYDRLT